MKKLKNILIVWVAIYPTITIIQFLFGELLNELPLVLRTLTLTGVLVPLMVFVLIPFWTRILTTRPKIKSLKNRPLR